MKADWFRLVQMTDILWMLIILAQGPFNYSIWCQQVLEEPWSVAGLQSSKADFNTVHINKMYFTFHIDDIFILWKLWDEFQLNLIHDWIRLFKTEIEKKRITSICKIYEEYIFICFADRHTSTAVVLQIWGLFPAPFSSAQESLGLLFHHVVNVQRLIQEENLSFKRYTFL